MVTNNMMPTFRTKSLRLSATLKPLGVPLLSWDRVGAEVMFVFGGLNGSLDAVVRDYHAGRLLVDPQRLFAALDECRDIVKNR
jgi:hypothetical protein